MFIVCTPILLFVLLLKFCLKNDRLSLGLLHVFVFVCFDAARILFTNTVKCFSLVFSDICDGYQAGTGVKSAFYFNKNKMSVAVNLRSSYSNYPWNIAKLIMKSVFLFDKWLGSNEVTYMLKYTRYYYIVFH